jgi:hypothetical protein
MHKICIQWGLALDSTLHSVFLKGEPLFSIHGLFANLNSTIHKQGVTAMYLVLLLQLLHKANKDVQTETNPTKGMSK